MNKKDVLLQYTNRFYAIFFLFLLQNLFLTAQTKNDFKTMLNQAEKRYNVKFSYADKSIEKIQIEYIATVNKFKTVEDFIRYINENTYLNLAKIDSRYISIALKKNLINICGYLKDSNGNSLPNASIAVLGKKTGTISNQEGFFEIPNLEISDFIQISHISYTPELKNVNLFYAKTNTCNTYTLNKNPITLQTVSIKGYLIKSLNKLNDGTVVLNTNAFKILGGQVNPDLLQTSQILPGVESHDESIANINVRNGASDQNVIYWDNIKLYNASHFFGLISGVNPFLTEKIAVVKDGSSAKYNDGVSSTFFLETNQRVNDSITSSIGADLVSADAYIKAPVLKNVQINCSARRSLNQFFTTPTYRSYFEKVFQNNAIANSSDRTNFSFYDINLNGIINLSNKQRISLNFITINNKLEHQENPQSNLRDAIRQNSIAYGLAYNLDVSNSSNISINAYRTTYKLKSDNYQNNQLQLLQQENKVIENAFKINMSHAIKANHSVNVGYQLNETGVLNAANVDDPFFIRIQKGVMLYHSAYGEYLYKNKKLYARAGLRFNYFDKVKQNTIEPRFNVNYKVSKSLRITGKYEQKSQYTSQVIDFLDDFLGIENRRWVISDSTIPLIKSSQFSGGITYSKKHFFVDINVFNKQTNGILISGQGFQNQILDRRLSGKQRAFGVETIINNRFNKLNFWSSYTLSKSDLLFTDITDNYFPANNDVLHSSTTGLAYVFSKKINASFMYTIKSGKPYSIPENGNETTKNGSFTVVNYTDLNTERLPFYSRLDASVSYSQSIKNRLKIDIKAGILNILNTKQSLQRYYIVDETTENNVREINLNSLKLTPNISIRAIF